MHPVLEDLIQLLRLERIEDNIFRGDSRDIGSPQVFGGQVLGQALSAAQHTVEDRVAHSLHAYFLRRGDINAPIVYEVDRARDGGSFSNRRVVAIQHGRPILNLAASFQVRQDGLSHQCEMPDVPAPDGLKDLTRLAEDVLDRIPVKLRRFMTDQRPFEFRPVPHAVFSARGEGTVATLYRSGKLVVQGPDPLAFVARWTDLEGASAAPPRRPAAGAGDGPIDVGAPVTGKPTPNTV